MKNIKRDYFYKLLVLALLIPGFVLANDSKPKGMGGKILPPGFVAGEGSHPKKINDKILVKILNESKMQFLNDLDPKVEKTLSLRLFPVPNSGACVRETEAVCSFDYYLAVSEFDEHPAQSVFFLGQMGELTEFRWAEGAKSDQAKVSWTQLKYPTSALKAENSLKQESKIVNAEIAVSGIKLGTR